MAELLRKEFPKIDARVVGEALEIACGDHASAAAFLSLVYGDEGLELPCPTPLDDGAPASGLAPIWARHPRPNFDISTEFLEDAHTSIELDYGPYKF